MTPIADLHHGARAAWADITINGDTYSKHYPAFTEVEGPQRCSVSLEETPAKRDINRSPSGVRWESQPPYYKFLQDNERTT